MAYRQISTLTPIFHAMRLLSPQDLIMKNTLALMAVCLAALMSGLEISSVPVLSPVLEQELHASFRELQWIMNAYTLACTTVLMATGTLEIGRASCRERV